MTGSFRPPIPVTHAGGFGADIEAEAGATVDRSETAAATATVNLRRRVVGGSDMRNQGDGSAASSPKRNTAGWSADSDPPGCVITDLESLSAWLALSLAPACAAVLTRSGAVGPCGPFRPLAGLRPGQDLVGPRPGDAAL